MTHEEMEAKLQEALDRIAKLEANVERLIKADACPDCGGRPGRLCSSSRRSTRRSRRHRFQALVKAAVETRQAADRAQQALDEARGLCQHNWTEPEYTPVRTKGYRTQSIMGHFTVGADGRVNAPEVHIPPTETPRWTRTCQVCGLEQTTDEVIEHVTSTPKF